MTLLSIVTVTYNDLSGFIRTANSILPFLDCNIEWLVKDGLSKPSIVSSIREYMIHPSCRLFSSPDLGIYDAMNFCLEQANSDWLIFMNGGDTFELGTIVSLLDFLGSNANTNKSIVCGGTKVVDCSGSFRFSSARSLRLCTGLNSYRMSSFHQSQVFHRSLYRMVSFNLDLKISADHAYFWECIKNGGSVIVFSQVISCFYYDGISSLKPVQSALDNWFTFRNIQKLGIFTSVFAFFKKLIIESLLAFCRSGPLPVRQVAYKLFFTSSNV